jgi:hypothetical protein
MDSAKWHYTATYKKKRREYIATTFSFLEQAQKLQYNNIARSTMTVMTETSLQAQGRKEKLVGTGA